jgi:two-component system, response regulator PdtaR
MQRLRILIAADKDFIAWRLRAQLEALGHKVLGIVRDGPAAAEAGAQSPPDLIFLDQHLPPHDGIEAARGILDRQIVPLVLLIGYPAAGLVKKAREAGVLAHLVWPGEAKALEAAIDVAQMRFRELRILYEEIGELQQTLRTRMVVSRAKTLLTRRLGLAEVDAFGYVLRQSRKIGTSVGEVAESLLAAEGLLFGKPALAGCVADILRVLARPGVLAPVRIA